MHERRITQRSSRLRICREPRDGYAATSVDQVIAVSGACQASGASFPAGLGDRPDEGVAVADGLVLAGPTVPLIVPLIVAMLTAHRRRARRCAATRLGNQVP